MIFTNYTYFEYKKNYDIKTDEILIRETNLTQEYFSILYKNLNLINNPYIQNLPFDDLELNENNYNEENYQIIGSKNNKDIFNTLFKKSSLLKQDIHQNEENEQSEETKEENNEELQDSKWYKNKFKNIIK